MTNYNANNTTVNTTTADTINISITEGRKWRRVLDAEDAFAYTNASLLEAIVNMIIANTSVRTNVNEDALINITETLRDMSSKCGRLNICINDKVVEVLDFSSFTRNYGVSEISRNLMKILNYISSNNIWFEDNYSGGFCCKGDHGDDMIIVTMETTEEDELI